MILTNSGVLKLMQRIKSFITAQLNTKANSVHTHTLSEIDDLYSLQMGGGYTKSEVDSLLNDYIPKSGGAVLDNYMYSRSVNYDVLRLTGGTAWANGAGLALFGKDRTSDAGVTFLKADNGTSFNQIALYPSGMFTQNVNETIKHIAMQEDVIPRSGGAVMTREVLSRTSNTTEFRLDGGTGWGDGASICLRGKGRTTTDASSILFSLTKDSTKNMLIYPTGTWTWDGTAVQITSDARLKQQITQIDNALLDAWEDVTLCQFKYNDAVEQKGNDNARLHTGYVVQQIDDACKSHNIDISNYGLYCHEEYPEETEEVEVTQEDGTIKKETKVIREASEHYSLRYTEALIVECAYLRREINRLKEQMKK